MAPPLVKDRGKPGLASRRTENPELAEFFPEWELSRAGCRISPASIGRVAMAFRSWLAIGVTLAATTLSSYAMAAVTVLGNGLGASCYQAAEFGIDPKSSIQTCTLAIEQEPLSLTDRAATYVNRGILRSQVGDQNGALSDYNHGIHLDANHGEGYIDRGATYIVLQRYDDALNDLNKGIEMGAHKPHIAYYDRAIVDEAMGNVRAAYQDYKKAVELQPDFTLASEQLTRFKVIRKESSSNE
jgi:tetratricopeptide (TPR) repeat protein